jgi:hypothetical protein
MLAEIHTALPVSHEIFSSIVESCSLDAEATEFYAFTAKSPNGANIELQSLFSILCSENQPMHQSASSETLLEIEHACAHCPLDPQRLAHHNGTIDDRAGGLGHLEISSCNYGSEQKRGLRSRHSSPFSVGQPSHRDLKLLAAHRCCVGRRRDVAEVVLRGVVGTFDDSFGFQYQVL